MLDSHRKIQALIDSFVADLGEIAKQIALEQLKTAFASVKLAPLPTAAAAPARATAAVAAPARGTAAATARATATATATATGRGGRARRGQHEIEALSNKLLAVISDNPGCRAEEINNALGTKTPQIAQPLRRLVADRLVRTEGARRGTRYFAVGPGELQNGRWPSPPPQQSEDAAAGAEDPPA